MDVRNQLFYLCLQEWLLTVKLCTWAFIDANPHLTHRPCRGVITCILAVYILFSGNQNIWWFHAYARENSAWIFSGSQNLRPGQGKKPKIYTFTWMDYYVNEVYPYLSFSITASSNRSAGRLFVCPFLPGNSPKPKTKKPKQQRLGFTAQFLTISSHHVSLFDTMRVELIGHFKPCMTDI